jgi:polyferredoxin
MASGTEDGGREPTEGTTASPGEHWGTAALKSLIVVLLSVAGFVVVPHVLYVNVIPHLGLTVSGGDLIVMGWVFVFFVFLVWLFVRLQRRRREA